VHPIRWPAADRLAAVPCADPSSERRGRRRGVCGWLPLALDSGGGGGGGGRCQTRASVRIHGQGVANRLSRGQQESLQTRHMYRGEEYPPQVESGSHMRPSRQCGSQAAAPCSANTRPTPTAVEAQSPTQQRHVQKRRGARGVPLQKEPPTPPPAAPARRVRRPRRHCATVRPIEAAAARDRAARATARSLGGGRSAQARRVATRTPLPTT